MGKEVPNLLWLMNPIETIPAAIKSFFPPKPPGEEKETKLETSEIEDSKDDKKKKKKKKVNPKDLKISKLQEELKAAKKKKILIFKVNRVDLGGDSVAEQTGYEQTGTTVITQPIVKETIVPLPRGKNIALATRSAETKTNMEAALS